MLPRTDRVRPPAPGAGDGPSNAHEEQPEMPGLVAEPFDLTDPALYADDAFMAVFARLRRDSPMYFHPEPDGPGFWVVSRYRDIQSVYTDAATYASRWGMRLGNRAEAVEAVAGRMLTVSDPPQHTRVRRVVASAFSGRRLDYMSAVVDEVVEELFAGVLSAGDGDFVARFARHLPTHAICAMLNLPRADWETIGSLASDGLASDDEDIRLTANADIFMYFDDLVAERRGRPGNDLVSLLLAESEASGARLTDEELVVNLSGILTGANETTRYVVAGSMLAFARHPDQWQQLKSPDVDLARAIEELLRWTTPGVHTLRTVTTATTLAGVALRPGDRVTVWNCSANRDEAVFPDADTFSITRESNPHFAFGYGRHLCVGARLARMEIDSFLRVLRRRVERIVEIGPITWSTSNFARGPLHAPLRLVPAASV